MTLPISDETWKKLVDINEKAAWASKGVFATGVGSHYVRKGPNSILFVGKSAGKLGNQVSSANNQIAIGQDSRDWMENWRLNNPRSSFWQFAQRIGSIPNMAWTNVCKMDTVASKGPPPRRKHWQMVSEICLRALDEEIRYLQPQIIVFTISADYKDDVINYVRSIGYEFQERLADGCTEVFIGTAGECAFITRHPQGWSNIKREPLISALSARISN